MVTGREEKGAYAVIEIAVDLVKQLNHFLPAERYLQLSK
jgi:hypothetical protein